MATRKSASKRLREEGNKLFASFDDNLAPVLRKARLEQAICKYNQASIAAQDMDEKASALKNIAVASSKQAMLLNPDKGLQLLIYHLRTASECFSQSYSCAEGVKSTEWKEHLISSIRVFIEGVVEMAASLTFHMKLSLMEASVYSLDIYSLRAEFSLQIAELCFHESIYRLDEKDFRGCLGRLTDCYRPIEEADKCKCNDAAVLSGIAVIKEDVKHHQCRAESLQALNIGDELYARYCKDESNRDMEMAWDILDWYKKAVLLTHELEVEIEAIAISRIGRLYDQVFKIKSKARESFKAAIALALSMHPRTFNNDDWFRECSDTLERYQKEQLEQESERWNKEREKYVKELEKELGDLATHAKKSDIDLLKWVYKTHPPKKAAHNLPTTLPKLCDGKELYDSEMKSLMKKAVVYYHPDRSEPEVNGKKWLVLCEEICKIFTRRYESFKCVE